MRGNITERILEYIAESAVASLDLLEIFLSSGRNTSSFKFNRALDEKQTKRAQANIDYRIRQNFHNRLYALKKDGLIAKKEDTQKWYLTIKGKTWLHNFNKNTTKTLPQTHYTKTPSKEVTIIVFDIPEQDRKKRNWLRGQLIHLGFTMLQKSVWIGKKQIPEEFIEDLNSCGIFDYVEILSITKQGTIKKIQ